jgi:hypothetical protein
VARAFIVRPFGEKKFGKDDKIAVNFDDVEKELIDPALKDLNIEGRTTAEILESGNIRNDMFQRLLVSDLVIADLTVHNANVFYELGIRHALREKRTFLIYSRIEDEQLPFDLQTDRYLAYDHKEPAKSLPTLIAGLRKTLASDDKDSPVFRLLPALHSQDPGRFMVVPSEFRDDVQHAEDRRHAGMLALLATEVAALLWEQEGLRLVANAQCRSNFLSAAKDTWERVLRFDAKDREANLQLGAIYQTLEELDKSNRALERVLENAESDAKQRAEAHALKGRNAVLYWRRAVSHENPSAKQTTALLSPRLEESYAEFRQAFEQDLHCYNFGVEALARLTVWTTLADRLPQPWEDANDPPEEAARRLATLKADRVLLGGAVDLSVEIAKRQAGGEGAIDLRISRAQLALLNSKKAERVRSPYLAAVEYASPSDIAELERFHAGFDDIDVLADNVAVARAVIQSRTVSSSSSTLPRRALVFRGYRERLLAREQEVATWIQAQIEAELATVGDPSLLTAIGAGGCGADIVFHEICQTLKVRSSMHLPFTPEQYIARFVQCKDPQWIERFRKLATIVAVSVLQPSSEMPRWLKDREAYTFVERWNAWMIAVARASASDVTVIAICDESQPDEDGVNELVKRARQTGAKLIVAEPASFDGHA